MIQIVLGSDEVIWRGNAGSAADAHHLTAKLVGRLERERCAIYSITTAISILTTIGNNYFAGVEGIFSRHIRALCQPGDLVGGGISTFGSSNKVCAALRTAFELGAVIVALIEDGGGAAQLAHIAVRVPSNEIARVPARIRYGYILRDFVGLSIARQQAAQGGTVAA